MNSSIGSPHKVGSIYVCSYACRFYIERFLQHQIEKCIIWHNYFSGNITFFSVESILTNIFEHIFQESLSRKHLIEIKKSVLVNLTVYRVNLNSSIYINPVI